MSTNKTKYVYFDRDAVKNEFQQVKEAYDKLDKQRDDRATYHYIAHEMDDWIGSYDDFWDLDIEMAETDIYSIDMSLRIDSSFERDKNGELTGGIDKDFLKDIRKRGFFSQRKEEFKNPSDSPIIGENEQSIIGEGTLDNIIGNVTKDYNNEIINTINKTLKKCSINKEDELVQ